MTARLQAAIVALGTALACGLLGSSVSEAPPGALDRMGGALAGELPEVAQTFSASCWWYVLAALGIAAIVFAAVRADWRRRIAFSVVTTLVAWQGSDALKNLFARPRPPYWILNHETSWSYPSGHAMFAVVVFGLWSYYVATSSLPETMRRGFSAAIALWGIGVIWSRLALGAHYVTDLIGGVLLGITMLAIATSIAGGIPALRRRST